MAVDRAHTPAHANDAGPAGPVADGTQVAQTATVTETEAGAEAEAGAETTAGAEGAAEGATTLAATATSYPIAPGYSVNVRSGPSTRYSLVRVLPPGSWVRIRCQTPGQTITGPYGTTSLWDNIALGEFISDAYVKTGSDGYVAPRCT